MLPISVAQMPAHPKGIRSWMGGGSQGRTRKGRGRRDGAHRGRHPWARRGERHRRRAFHNASRLLFWSGHDGERKKRGRGQGMERPLCLNGKGSGNGLGRGLVAASRWSVDHGEQQQQARSHVRAAGVGGGGWTGPGTGMGWRHSVPRPVHPPHRQQRGAGAVE